MDFFENVEQVPPDPIFGLNAAFIADPRKEKVNLGVGVYRTADLKPFILTTIKEAEWGLLGNEVSKDYLPIDGLNSYIESVKELVFGEKSARIYGAQSVGGTGALRLGGAFLRLHGYDKIYLPDPTWVNHQRVFRHAGFDVNFYPYCKQNRLDFEDLKRALKQMPRGGVVLLHACCHNPTGIDPSTEEWEALCELMQKRELFPFFDFAYQGFGVDPEKDAAPIRHFVNKGFQCAIAVSHAKNFGLYAERTGALYFVCDSEKQATRVGSRLKMLIRGLYSNPPCHGALLVAMVLQEPALKQKWLHELAEMHDRIGEMRRTLVALLKEKSARFDFLEGQKGMFSYTGIAPAHVERLVKDFGIYLTSDGRINVAGLNQQNVTYVANAILTTVSV